MKNDSVIRLNRSLTIEQRNDLMNMADECLCLGATTKQLAPIYAVCTLEKPKLTKEEKAHAKKLSENMVKNYSKGIVKL